MAFLVRYIVLDTVYLGTTHFITYIEMGEDCAIFT